MKATSLDHLMVSSPEFEGSIASLPKSEQRALRKAYWLIPRAGRIVIEHLLWKYQNANVQNDAGDRGISVVITEHWSHQKVGSGNRYSVAFNRNTPGPQHIDTQYMDHPEFSRRVRFTYDNDGRLLRVQEYDLSSVLKREVLVVYDDSDGTCIGEGIVSTRHKNPHIRRWYGPDGLKFAKENTETCDVVPFSPPAGYMSTPCRIDNTPAGVLIRNIEVII
ncbi:MAG: hypothetical protein AABW49_00440 [Nanoarchaeota archaeon]